MKHSFVQVLVPCISAAHTCSRMDHMHIALSIWKGLCPHKCRNLDYFTATVLPADVSYYLPLMYSNWHIGNYGKRLLESRLDF